jgi:hypothetical protein
MKLLIHPSVAAELKLQLLTELEKMTSRCRITILDLVNCGMSGQDAQRFGSAGTVPSVVSPRILMAIRSEIKEQGGFLHSWSKDL